MIRNDINLYFSGGSSNNDGNASLGGDKSTNKIVHKSWTAFSTLTGVTISKLDSTCPIGDASFNFVYSSTQLQWKSYGGIYGSLVDISADGTYDLVDNDGYYVSVTVVSANLPTADTTDTTTVADVLDVLFDTVSKSDTYSGSTNYRGIYLANDVSYETDYLVQPKLEVLTEQNTLSSGTATSATSTTLSDSSKSWTTNQYTNYFIRLTGGTGAGQSRTISSNTATEITVSAAWDTTPSTDTTYEICSSLLDFGFEDIYFEESIGTGDGTTTQFTGNVTNTPVLAGQIQITDGTETFTDWDGDGTMTGSAGGTGTFTYSSGAYNVTFNTAPANGADIKAYYSVQLQTIADENTVPSGVTFSHPVSAAPMNVYGVTYDYLRGKGYSQGIWVRRKVYHAFDSSIKYQIKISGKY